MDATIDLIRQLEVKYGSVADAPDDDSILQKLHEIQKDDAEADQMAKATGGIIKKIELSPVAYLSGAVINKNNKEGVFDENSN